MQQLWMNLGGGEESLYLEIRIVVGIFKVGILFMEEVVAVNTFLA